MIKWVIALPVLLLFLSASNTHAVSGDDIIGLWLTTEGKSTVEISKQGDTYGGKIVALKKPLDEHERPKTDHHNPDPALRDTPLIGLKLVWGFTFKGDGVWGGGRIYDPETGKVYYCKMTLLGNQLHVRGSLDRWGIAGRPVTWTRKPADETK